MATDGGKEVFLSRQGRSHLVGHIIVDGLRSLGRLELLGGAFQADDVAQATLLPAGRERERGKGEEGGVTHFQTAMCFVHTLEGAQRYGGGGRARTAISKVG